MKQYAKLETLYETIIYLQKEVVDRIQVSTIKGDKNGK